MKQMIKPQKPLPTFITGVMYCLIALFVFAFWSCTLEKPPIRPQRNLSKDQPVYYDFIARKYYVSGDYEKAIFQYQRILDKFSNRSTGFDKELAWAEYEIGYCYYLMGDNAKATEYFDRVINNYNQTSARIIAQKILQKIQQTP